MFDPEDDGTRVGVVTALGVTVLVLFGLIGGLVIRHMGDKAVAPASTAMAVAAAPTAVETLLLDEPISGDLVATLYFALGSATLPTDAANELTKGGAALAGASGKRLVLSGFHDPSGDATHNAELARQRAIAARDALIAAGVAADRIALRKPDVTTGDGPAEEARRVEIRLAD